MNELVTDFKSLEFETLKNLRSSKAANTLRAYRADFKDFSSLFKIKTNLLVFLQGIFGTIPWGVFSIFIFDYFIMGIINFL